MLRRILAATTLAVSVERAKARLRVDDVDDFDDELETLIKAATLVTEARTGLVLQSSGWEWLDDMWPIAGPWCQHVPQTPWYGPLLQIPQAPIREISAITFRNADNVDETVAPADWSWERTTEGADIRFVQGYAFPVLTPVAPPIIRVAFTAGFDNPSESGSGDDPELKLPATAELAVLYLVAHWFRNRESVNIGNITSEIPQTFGLLVDQLKIYR